MNKGKPRRILIIDDHPLLRKGLRQLADFSPEIEIIGEADNGAQGLTMARETQSDLVLLDLFMPGMTGLEALKTLKQLEPAPKVIVLTVSDAQEDIVAALRGGADGYLLKDTDPEELLMQLCEAGDDGPILSPRIAERLGDAAQAEIQRVLIIDDHPLLRKGLHQLAELSTEIKLVGEADNGAQGVAMARELQPDLILLDLFMPGMTGLETLKALKQLEPVPKVVVLTVSDAQEDIFGALRAGADGYLLKDTDPEDLLDRLHELTKGKFVMSPGIVEHLALALRTGDVELNDTAPRGLTGREYEILLHISEGESNKIIARNLHIAEATVKVHVKHLLKKLGLRSRVEAAVWAVNHRQEL